MFSRIENRPHWILDVVFKDDLTRLRTGHGPANMAVVRHMAVNLLSQATATASGQADINDVYAFPTKDAATNDIWEMFAFSRADSTGSIGYTL